MAEMFTRRDVLRRAGVGGTALALAGAASVGEGLANPAGRADSAVVPLPSPAQVRADFQRMVDFGPRLTGSDNHNRYIAWLEEQLVAAGVELIPCSSYETTRWEVGSYGLELLDGVGAGPVRVTSYYPRSLPTPAAGVTGRLVYGGVAPLPDLGTEPAALAAGIAAYPAQLAGWAQALPSLLEGVVTRGSILLIDLPIPAPLTTAIFPALGTYLNWDGHTLLDWAAGDYKRNWLLPGLGVPLSPFQALGAAGLVFILDGSYAAMKGGYTPFVHGTEPLPALYVDRDTGTTLRRLAAAAPRARLTLTATRTLVRTPSIVGILHGETEENVILNTHTDGQGFAEENGGVCLVHLARHFGSLPPGRRLRRSIVFSLFTGHMDPELPETQGFIDDNPRLIANAAAALTIEHFGCSEWIDSADRGYHATGNPEALGVWTTQGDMFQVTRDALIAAGIQHAALLRPPVQFGVGGAFQTAGIPQLGAIAGPTYLVTIDENGDMDKLDESLAARQIAWIADIMRRLESYTPAQLRRGDVTLGHSAPATPGTGGIAFKYATCAAPSPPSPGRLVCRVMGSDRDHRGLRLVLHMTAGDLHRITVRLERGGHVVARTYLSSVGTRNRALTLRPLRRHRYLPGRYLLTISDGGRRTLVRRTVTLR